MDRIAEYFDLTSEWKKEVGKNAGEIPGWLMGSGIQYLGLILGIILQPYLTNYQETGVWGLQQAIGGRIIFSIVTGLLILPAVYKKSFDPKKPWLVQFGAIVTAAMGWQSLMASAMTATGGPPTPSG